MSDAIEKYRRLTRQAQADHRVPALQVAMHRADRPLWTYEVGASGTDRPLDASTQFRLGSVTKTFTAVLVMQCRDDGLLDLDDRIGTHVDLPAHGDLTIRRLLSHTSGIQREPHGDIWDSLAAPDVDGLLADLDRAERVLPGRRFHYSNLGVGLLGHMVGRLRGGTWAELLRDRILRPLGLDSVTVYPTERAAVGYTVDVHSDYARPEPATDTGAIAPAAQLWGTAADLSRWAAYLVDPATIDPTEAVLAPATVAEMRRPLIVTDEALWTAGFGLGLIVQPQGKRIVHVGHDGAMPGFLAGVYGRHGGDGTPAALGVTVLSSSGTAGDALALTHTLLVAAVEHDPADVPRWRIGEPAPEAYRSVLGRWWSEGYEFVFFWRDGALRARGADDATGRPPSVFAPIQGENDVLRTVSGREAGERLRLTRDPDTGAVVRMHWATYRYTRGQETFTGLDLSGG